MAWKVEFHPGAIRELRKLDPQTASRVLSFLQTRVATSKDPRSVGEALKGASLGGFWRYRVGDYRVIADIWDRERVVYVNRVAHRRKIYRG